MPDPAHAREAPARAAGALPWPLRLSRAACAASMACAGPLGLPGTAGWTRTTRNPSFPCTLESAMDALDDMGREPRPLERPLLVCAGFFDPGAGVARVRRILAPLMTNPEKIVAMSFLTCRSFEACRRRLLDALESRFPAERPGTTIEVDAIGISMGGIVARFAAIPGSEGTRRLNLRTLFTISTPHSGAAGASLGFFDRRAADMRPGSGFLSRLNALGTSRPSQVLAYVRLGDWLVGADHARWLDGSVRWLPNLPFQLPHAQAFDDPRILADIARRLRGEAALSSERPDPLPRPPGSSDSRRPSGVG